MSSFAFATPTIRGSRCVPPAPGMMARLVSVSPIRTFEEQMRMSQASASSVPPPKAKPLIAAMTGTRTFSTAVKVLRIVKMKRRTWSCVSVRLSFRSAPVEKDHFLGSSPALAPVMMMHRRLRSKLASRMTSARAASRSKLKQFMASGRFRVRIRMPSSVFC